MIGAGERIRTTDRLITNQLLYQLSYTSFSLTISQFLTGPYGLLLSTACSRRGLPPASMQSYTELRQRRMRILGNQQTIRKSIIPGCFRSRDPVAVVQVFLHLARATAPLSQHRRYDRSPASKWWYRGNAPPDAV